MQITYANEITAVQYNSLRVEAGWESYSQKQMQAAIDGSAFVVAAVDNGSVIGAARLISDGACYGIIGDVVVKDGYQGCGIGKELITRIIEFIKLNLEEGEKYRVNVMAYKGRCGFYKKLGFVSRPNDKYDNGLTMELTCNSL